MNPAHVVACAALLTGCAITRPTIETANTAPTRHPSADLTAFCGPDPQTPHWREQLYTLATIGITAVHGPCRLPPADYQILHPGDRYATQADQLTLAAEAQRIRIGIIPYDPQFWTDPQAALTTWAPYIADGTLVAVDLGDEPGWTDMPELRRRADIVRSIGLQPQTIFVGTGAQVMGSVLDQYAALPTDCPISDDYANNASAMADAYALRLVAGCAGIAIDTTGRDLDGDGDRWSVSQIERARAAGFRITLFTGVAAGGWPDWDTLVDAQGRLTAAGRAVKGVLG